MAFSLQEALHKIGTEDYTAFRKFASSATGKILTLTANAPADSIFVQSVFQAALDSLASTINGLLREDLLRARDALVAAGKAADRTAAEKILVDTVNFQSRIDASFLKIATKRT